MKPDDIISCAKLVAEERANLQKEMNCVIGRTRPKFLVPMLR